MKRIKIIMVLLIMFVLSILSFALPMQCSRVYADTRVTNLTNTEWIFHENVTAEANGVEYYVEYIWRYGSESEEVWTDETAQGWPGNKASIWFYDGDVFFTTNDNAGFAGPADTRHLFITGGDDVTNSDLIDWLYNNADLQVEEPAQTGVITDIVIPVVLALVVGTIIAFVVMDSKKVFVK